MLVSLGAVTLVGCAQQEEAPQVQVEAVSVESEEVTAADVPQTLRLTGTLRGSKETDLAANVAGRISKTLVDRGAEVKSGELLAQVDVSAAALSLAEAKVQVETTKRQQEINQAECERYEKLKERGAVSDLEYDQVTAKCKTAPLQVQAAQARQSIAAKNVGDGAIRSPFAGVVTERAVEVGEYVQAASRVVSIAQVDELRLEFSVPEANYTHVKKDALVAFRVAAYGDQVFYGKVTHISGAIRDTRDVLVEAVVDNQDRKLVPGMFANVELSVGKKSLPTVPESAVFDHNGKKNVFLIQDGQLMQRVVQVGPVHEGRIPVVRGLQVGDRIVKTYSSELSNGQAVN